MKAIIFLADGMADEPLAELNHKTPLEAAHTPGMDAIAREGQSGTFLSLPDGLPTSSDVANMSVLGFYPEKNYPGRGPIEAMSQQIHLAPDDIAWRCNLVTVDENQVLRDYSAGHIDNEISSILMRDLQSALGSDKVTFHPGVSYRNLLVLHGSEFSAAIDYFKPDSSQDIPVAELPLQPLNDDPATAHTIAFLEDLSRKAHDFLTAHPLYQSGKSAATDIWPWSPGHCPNLTPFAVRYGSRGAIISAVDVIKGLGKCTGMTVVDVPGATGFLDTNYEGKVEAALKAIEDHDFVYVHVEAVDECSHMGDLKLKLQAIEEFDRRIVCPIRAALQGRKINFAILPDHPVPIRLRQHTTTPVPVAVCGPSFAADDVQYYSETLAPTGKLGFLKGDQLVKILLEDK
ncbi:MAG: cofactor-independent phosphoglycerate mutase [Lentisphaeria bacterium]|nr:cofactor-independent phosphoglycerate mutase [Lentisphaeria bacterium]